MTNQERFDMIRDIYRMVEKEQVKRKKILNLLKIKIIAGLGNVKETEQ